MAVLLKKKSEDLWFDRDEGLLSWDNMRQEIVEAVEAGLLSRLVDPEMILLCPGNCTPESLRDDSPTPIPEIAET